MLSAPDHEKKAIQKKKAKEDTKAQEKEKDLQAVLDQKRVEEIDVRAHAYLYFPTHTHTVLHHHTGEGIVRLRGTHARTPTYAHLPRTPTYAYPHTTTQLRHHMETQKKEEVSKRKRTSNDEGFDLKVRLPPHHHTAESGQGE